mmetsp:Transcript_57715/g.178866  ORF Transcript_57715/g.178866 Transcript_57715/m.178866 type:complete len:409 (+) Transcript_57715:1320-2546(+)
MSTSRCKASLARVLSANASFAACSSPAFWPIPSSKLRIFLAMSTCPCMCDCAWTSTRRSNMSRQSRMSRSLAPCASSRCTSICSRNDSLLRTASPNASSDSRTCSFKASAVALSRSRSPSAWARCDSSCRAFLRAVCIIASCSATSLASPSARSCNAARSASAEAASASRVAETASTRAWRSETSRSRRAMSSSSSPAKALWRLLQVSVSLSRTSRSARSFTCRLCSRSWSLERSLCICWAVAAILSTSEPSSCFRLVAMPCEKLWTSAFSWPCTARSAPDLAATALARRQHSSSLEVSCSAMRLYSSSQRFCSSSRVRCASCAQKALSCSKVSSKRLRLSMSVRRCCVRVLSSSVCFWTSSTSRRFVPFNVRSVPWSSSLASATRSMSLLRSWQRFCASLRLCRRTS